MLAYGTTGSDPNQLAVKNRSQFEKNSPNFYSFFFSRG
jgi:hypothetical protein